MLLHRLSIRTKLALLAGIPVLGALVLSIIVIQGARENAKTAESIGSIEDLAELSNRMRDVASSLQTERARTAWSAGKKLDIGETATGERAATDNAIQHLNGFIAARDQSKLPPRLARDLGKAREQLGKLAEFRIELSKGEVPLERQLDFYSEPTLSLIGATAALTELSNDASLLRSIASLASTMEVKERQSLEHALLVNVFGAKQYPPGMFRRFVTLDTEEQVYSASLVRSASDLHRRIFERAFASPESKRAAAMKKLALESTDDEIAIDAQQWYVSQAQLIDDLGAVERTLGDQVRQAASSKLVQARQAMRVGSGLTAAVLLISLLLAALIGRGVAKSLAALSEATQRVRRNQDFTVRAARLTEDEIGALADTFNEMLSGIQDRDRELQQHRAGLEHLVEERTQELSRRNAAMRLVLDNVAQGLATVDISGKLAAERSAAFDRWFGAPGPNVPFAAHLAGEDLLMQQSILVAFEQLLEEFLPIEVSLDMLPKRIQRNGRHFALEYSPLLRNGRLDGLLMMITDITTQVLAEQAEREQRQQIRTFQHVLRDRIGFVQFFADARRLVERIRDDQFEDAAERRRIVHTLKGNASLFAVEAVVDAAHHLEQALDEANSSNVKECRGALVDSWDDFAARTVPLLGEDLGDRIELTRAELETLLSAVRQGVPKTVLETKIAQLAFEPMRARFNRIGAQLKGLAKRLDKAEPTVVVDDGGVRLPPNKFAPLWSSFSHLVRNIVDHGLDDPESRVKAGKNARAQVTLTARETAREVTLVIEDNGRGIDWTAVREKARQKGLPCTTRADLVMAIQSSGFSTASVVTSTSGRGVGLSAVAAAVGDLAGKLSIDSDQGKGTRFAFTFNLSDTLSDAVCPRLSGRPVSVTPREQACSPINAVPFDGQTW